MFSPSLISMIVHSLDGEPRLAFAPPSVTLPKEFATSQDIADALQAIIDQYRHYSWPLIPVIGRTDLPREELFRRFQAFARFDDRDGNAFFWGRIPLDILVRFFSDFHAKKAEEEYADLGTPVYASGSGSSYDKNCASLLARSATHATPSAAKVGAAIIDWGDARRAPPDNYSGQLRHAVSTRVGLSDHAEKVLSVLLDRLDRNKILADTAVSCSLVIPPAAMIALGRSCFEQAGTAEILDAVKALDMLLAGDPTPTAINMSLGTHVGPHNGQSPLEEYISGTLTTNGRFLVVSAGNEDRFGCSAKRDLLASEDEVLTLNTGPLCQELLVEFWWDDSSAARLSVEADVWDFSVAGSPSNLGTIKIDRRKAGATLAKARAALPASIVAHSLFSAKCQGNFSCIAFAMSATTGSTLSGLQVLLTLTAAKDVAVNAWIVIAEDNPLTALVGGGRVGTITVPATDSSVLSVAGLDSSGNVWKGSSRGPSAEYDPATPATESPLMAHRADLGTDFGTSIASPRACADAAVALADPKRRVNCKNAKSLMVEAYGLPASLPAWNPRAGFHRQKT